MLEFFTSYNGIGHNLIAIESASYSITYSELLSEINILANSISQHFHKPSLIAIVHSNPIIVIKLYLALLHAKHTVVLINHNLTRDEILSQLASISCDSVICDYEYIPYFDDAQFNLFTININSELSDISYCQNSVFYNSKLENIDTVIFTSGSSGKSKAVAHTLKAHLSSAVSAIKHLNLVQSNKWLLNLPLYHVGGLAIVHRCILAGATIVIAKNSGNPIAELINHKITHASMVPTQLLRVINSIEQFHLTEVDIDLSSIKSILIGGAACSHLMKSRAKSLGLPVYYSYGSSEMGSLITLTTPESNVNSSGMILPHAEFMISDQGELLVKGESMFSGYLSKADNGSLQLINNFGDDNYFHTKDLAVVNSDGEIVIKGRIDNMFISGGENIYPEEIEQAISGFPGIESAIVVPIPDMEFGERPIAFIKTYQSAQVSIDELIQFLKTKITKFKIPIEFKEFPAEYTQTGIKINRLALKDFANDSYK